MTRSSPHICIVARDLSGFMAAAFLSRRYPSFRLTLIDMREGGQLAEAALFGVAHPDLRAFNRTLGLREVDFLRATAACFYLGDQYDGFGPSAFSVPFGDWGVEVGGSGYFAVKLAQGTFGTLADQTGMSFPASLIAANRFLPPDAKGRPILSDFDYGYQLDANRYAELLHSRLSGVEIVATSDVAWADTHLLLDGTALQADLFIDASGSTDNVFGAAPYGEDWSEYGFPKGMRARTAPRDAGEVLPLSADYSVDDGHIQVSLSDQLQRTELNLTQLGDTPCGRREAAWVGRILHLGLAQARLTPMLGSPIRSVILDLNRLADLMPAQFDNAVEAREYNRLTAEAYDRLRDAQCLALHGASVVDTPPETVTDKIALFAETGRMVVLDQDSLLQDQWGPLLLGTGIVPRKAEPLARLVPTRQSAAVFDPVRDFIAQVVPTLPRHAEFIARNCAADGFEI